MLLESLYNLSKASYGLCGFASLWAIESLEKCHWDRATPDANEPRPKAIDPVEALGARVYLS